MTLQRILSLGLLATLAGPVLAADEATGETVSRGPDTLMSLVSLGLGLVAVIALIFGCAWLVKRMTGLSGMNNQAMRVVSVLPMGTRERIALIDVGGTQILVGITPSAIRTLHVFDEPVVTGTTRNDSEFSKRLQAVIGRNWSDRSAASRDDRGGDV